MQIQKTLHQHDYTSTTFHKHTANTENMQLQKYCKASHNTAHPRGWNIHDGKKLSGVDKTSETHIPVSLRLTWLAG